MLINYTQTDGLHLQVFNPSPTSVTLKGVAQVNKYGAPLSFVLGQQMPLK